MPKRALFTEESPRDDNSCWHPYIISALPEVNHVIFSKAQTLMEEDEERCPGHNCCALCACVPDCEENLITCKECDCVKYCSESHQTADSETHSAVCKVLAMVKRSEGIEVSSDEESELLSEFSTDYKDVQTAEDWSSLAPQQYECLFGKKRKRDFKRSKRSHPESEEIVACSPDDQVEDSAEDEQLELATKFAIATSFLTYPFTVAKLLLSSAEGQDVVSRAVSNKQPLTLCVLGAGKDAELAHLHVWKVLSGICASGIRLQFVGPEVQDELHRQEETIAHDVTASFVQDIYQGNESTSSGNNASTSASGSPLPDVFVGFNMGLTCEDYDWGPSLAALQKVFSLKCQANPVGSCRMLLLTTSNTRLEMLVEEEVLLQQGWRPVLGASHNSFGSLETIQSGTLSNDIYRKSSWVAVHQMVQTPARKSTKAKVGGWLKKVLSFVPKLPFAKKRNVR